MTKKLKFLFSFLALGFFIVVVAFYSYINAFSESFDKGEIILMILGMGLSFFVILVGICFVVVGIVMSILDMEKNKKSSIILLPIDCLILLLVIGSIIIVIIR